MMTLVQCIREIITAKFGVGDYFDTHTVINLILQNDAYYLAYLQEFQSSNFSQVNSFHSISIAQNILDNQMNGIARKIDDIKVVSLNIHGNPTPNTLWQRIN